MLVLINQRASGFNRLLRDTSRVKIFLVKLNPATENARNLQKIIYQDDKVPGLTPNDGSRFLLDRMFIFLEIQKLDRICNGRERIAKLMGNHGQKLVLATMQVGQRFGLGRRSFQLCSFSHVSNIALNYSPMIFLIEVADKLNFPPLPALAFEWQMMIADITLLLQLLKRGFALVDILKQSYLPKFLAGQLVRSITQQLLNVRVRVGNLSSGCIEYEDAVSGRLKEAAISNF